MLFLTRMLYWKCRRRRRRRRRRIVFTRTDPGHNRHSRNTGIKLLRGAGSL